MIKVLILAHDFPPNRSVASLRPYFWHKYFNQNEIYSCVITRHWNEEVLNQQDFHKQTIKECTSEVQENGEVIKVPFGGDFRDKIIAKYGMNKYVLVRRIYSVFYLISRFYSFYFDSLSPIFRAAEDKLKAEKFDLIIATGEPFILFKYGNKLSKKFNVPWVADYRDNWAFNPRENPEGVLLKAINNIHKRFEKSYISNALFITVASPSYGMPLKRITNKEIVVVYNGFDAGLISNIEVKSSGPLMIAYTGIIYPHQPIEDFIGILKEVSEENENFDFEMKFYGTSFYEPNVERIARCSDGIEDKIQITDRVEYKLLLKQLQKADLLLLLSNEDVDWLNAKVFDYMAVNRKIMLFYSDRGVLDRLLSETNAGVSITTKDQLKSFLLQVAEEYNNKGFISNKTIGAENYSRQNQASVFCGAIKKRLILKR